MDRVRALNPAAAILDATAGDHHNVTVRPFGGDLPSSLGRPITTIVIDDDDAKRTRVILCEERAGALADDRDLVAGGNHHRDGRPNCRGCGVTIIKYRIHPITPAPEQEIAP